MRHEQDRLVPISEAVGELDVTVTAIPPAQQLSLAEQAPPLHSTNER